jgi:GDP/UDP-N,N'-diacetylbacillosamine 2-epimerase (hydrolysing)
MKICVVTATRAEFGLLEGLMSLIKDSPELTLQTVVTGSHLLREFGHTLDDIVDAGFAIDAVVPEISKAESSLDVANQVGHGVQGFARVLGDLKPDAIVILGDRYEMLAAATAAFFMKIPIVHVHGGEVTEGAFDDGIRHAITKFSRVHCVAAPEYRRRVVQLGEFPETVHVVGGLGVDQIQRTMMLGRDDIETQLELSFSTPSFLVTYHPETEGHRSVAEDLGEVVSALERFPEATVVFTMPNADPGHHIVAALLQDSVRRHQGRWHLFSALGRVRYLSVAQHVDVVVGNSSSGLLEIPSLKKPTVNIGNRQAGRLQASSVINSQPHSDEITHAIGVALSDKFRASLTNVVNPYGTPGASQKILSLLTDTNFGTLPLKSFYDVEKSRVWSENEET